MVAVIVDVISTFAAVLNALNTASYRSHARIVFAERFGVGQHSLEELNGHYLHPVVDDGVDAGHADVLYHAQVRQVLLSESHPETGPADGGIVFHE